ncbi:sigma factor-like helix-turn-helix DNA-binding protein [Cytobacillus firmus]|uniref:sigma factor-like helix-turn-helix DNA-binding protein n=1 Tax=Cytobacillus TaxID=2675230 RepID=UPI0037C19CB2
MLGVRPPNFRLRPLYYGLSVREIAEKERVSLSAVKNWRHGAREKLKKIMQQK